ncbi:unnamed protein product [Calicophoron daubneyi]|uniref:Legumain prodomain domain-containing protein n=1 Tax=Calicophoron daubneyi TaxID=300641 RepID=A0AAV2TTW7_CALDB
MRLFAIAGTLLLLCVLSTNADKWAILVAGSYSWSNYRHQSDIYHAYHVLLQHGFNMDHVITMAANDIAFNARNTRFGEVYNDYNYTDVYRGVKIDYSGWDVTPENFLKVLSGDNSTGKRVVHSTKEDEVFVFYSDHGASNLLAFPGDELYSSDLIVTLKRMYRNRQYKRMLLLIEACYSGSMFEDLLPENINVLALTAANSRESSYGTFCRPGYDLRTCLADEFSYGWMIAATENNVGTFTVYNLYNTVRRKIHSHAMMYGDWTLASLPLGQFITGRHFENSRRTVRKSCEIKDSIKSTEAHIVSMRKRLSNANSEEEKRLTEIELERMLHRKAVVQKTFDYLEERAAQYETNNSPVTRTRAEAVDCYIEIHKSFKKHCFTIQKTPEVIEHLVKFDDMCTRGVDPKVIVHAIETVCA